MFLYQFVVDDDRRIASGQSQGVVFVLCLRLPYILGYFVGNDFCCFVVGAVYIGRYILEAT